MPSPHDIQDIHTVLFKHFLTESVFTEHNLKGMDIFLDLIFSPKH